MNDGPEQLLAARLGELQAPTGEPDWGDVRRKAHRLATRRQTMRFGTGAAVAFLAILLATPALGLRGPVVRLFGGGESAPAPVVKDFGQIDVAAPPGMATGVIPGETRDVMEVPLSTGKTAVVWVAPTRSGGFCVFTSTDGRDSMGGGGCDRDRLGVFDPASSVGSVSSEGKIGPPVLLHGDTLIRGASNVQVQYEDGDSTKTPVVWVSAPIDAGFFVYEIPEQHWAAGHRPSLFVLEDKDGHELARDREAARAFNDSIRAMAFSAGQIASENARSTRH